MYRRWPHACTYVYILTSVYMRVCVCAHARVCGCANTYRINIWMYLKIQNTHIYIYIYAHVCVRASTMSCCMLLERTHTHIYILIYIYICIYRSRATHRQTSKPINKRTNQPSNNKQLTLTLSADVCCEPTPALRTRHPTWDSDAVRATVNSNELKPLMAKLGLIFSSDLMARHNKWTLQKSPIREAAERREWVHRPTRTAGKGFACPARGTCLGSAGGKGPKFPRSYLLSWIILKRNTSWQQ